MAPGLPIPINRRLFLPLLLLSTTLLAFYALPHPYQPTTLHPFSAAPPRVTEFFPPITSIWDHVAEITAASYLRPPRRPSWGALKEQGAKKRFKENLREEGEYFISFLIGGWHNQLISLYSLIHLAHLTGRIVILPAFSAASPLLGAPAMDVAVSDIFDVGRLSAALGGRPIIELHELKLGETTPQRLRSVVYDGEVGFIYGRVAGEQEGGAGSARLLSVGERIRGEEPELEDLGCWSFYASHGGGISNDQTSFIHTEHTPLPPSAFPSFDDEPRRASILSTAHIIRRGFPSEIPQESQHLIDTYSLPQPQVPPENHVACIDSTYWIYRETERFDMHGEFRAGEGVWSAVGKHLRFNAGWEEVARGFLRGLWGLREGEEIPPYMAIHIRRNDFATSWLDMTHRQFAHAAAEVLDGVRNDLGIAIKKVIVTTDEHDETWLAGLKVYGWDYVNHTEARTVERFGHWTPTILDSVLLSGGSGFLGCATSTMSILAYRRTIDWNDGVGRLIMPYHEVPDDWEWHWPE